MERPKYERYVDVFIEFGPPMAVTELSVLYDQWLYGTCYTHDFVTSALYVMYISVFNARHIHYYIPIIMAFYSINTYLYVPAAKEVLRARALWWRSCCQLFASKLVSLEQIACAAVFFSPFPFLCTAMSCGWRTCYEIYTDVYGSTGFVLKTIDSAHKQFCYDTRHGHSFL